MPHNFLFVHFIQVNKIDHAEQDGAGAGRGKNVRRTASAVSAKVTNARERMEGPACSAKQAQCGKRNIRKLSLPPELSDVRFLRVKGVSGTKKVHCHSI